MGLQVAEVMSGEPEYVSRPCRGTVHHVYVRRSKVRKHGSRGRLQNGWSQFWSTLQLPANADQWVNSGLLDHQALAQAAVAGSRQAGMGVSERRLNNSLIMTAVFI
jgi:hypothetical protein